MKLKNYSNKFLLIALIICSKTLLACGPEANDRAFHLFLKKINEQSHLYDYNFNSSRTFYASTNFENVYDSLYTKKQNALLNDWSKHFNNQFSINDISDFVFNTDNISINTYENKQKTKNDFQNYLIEKDTLLLHYYKLLADYDSYLNKESDDWQYESYIYKQDSSKLFLMIEETSNIYKKTNDNFLKWRCAYHIVRMAHFHKYEISANKFYDQFVKPLPEINSIIVAWCWGLKGGICNRLKQHNEAFYYFSKKFTKENYNADTYVDFSWLDSVNINEVFRFCKNHQDSVSVNIANGFTTSNINIESIKNAYSQGVYGNELTLLWQRELQKFEEQYIYHKLINQNLNEDYYYYGKSALNKNLERHFEEYILLTKKILEENKTNQNALWANGLSYLFSVKKYFHNAEKYLDVSKKVATDSIDIIQYKMNELLLNILKNETIDQTKLVRFCNEIKQNSLFKTEEKESYDLFIYNFVAPSFLKQKDTLNALYAFALRNDYSYMYWAEQNKDSIEFISSCEAITNFLNYSCGIDYISTLENSLRINTNKPFAEWCKNNFTYYINTRALIFLKLHKEVCNENWDNAMQYAKLLPNDERALSHYYYPFNVHYDDYRSPTNIDTLNKSKFTLEEILLLGKKLKEKTLTSKTPQDYFNYGMFLFNNTYYGKNSFVMDENTMEYRYQITPIYSKVKYMPTQEYYFSYYLILQAPLNDNALVFYNCSQATKNFKKAYEGFTKIEQKAVACFMLAKTTHYNAPAPKQQKNEYGWYDNVPEKWNGKDYDYYVYNSITNPYFKELQSKYKSTVTFKNAYDECSYFKLYVDGL